MRGLLITTLTLCMLNLGAYTWAKQLPKTAVVKRHRVIKTAVIKARKVIKEIKQSLVVIHLPDGTSGSGVIIKSNTAGSLVLTAKHVCYGSINEEASTS